MARYLCFVWMLRITGCGADGGIRAQSRCRRIVHIGRLFHLSACGYAVAEIIRAPTAAGADVIALEEHVDYWNHEGWNDPSPRQTGRKDS
jgi:hypothetical protein